jgi:trehalose 2-sulfotransferase
VSQFNLCDATSRNDRSAPREPPAVMTAAAPVLDNLRGSLLKRLADGPALLFVGSRDFLDYLAAFFGSTSLHAYIVPDAEPGIWQQMLAGRKTVVIVDDDEDRVSEIVSTKLEALGHAPMVTRLFADVFVNASSGGGLWKAAPHGLTAPESAYAVLSVPRTGTEFLCEALRSTNAAGYPKEHLRLHTETLTKYCRFDPNRFLLTLMLRLQTKNRVFGTKLISHFLMSHIKLCPAIDETLAGFKYVRVSRRDVVGQAISAMLASKTGTYHIRNEAEQKRYRERLVESQIDPADLRRVEQLRQNYARQNRQIDEFLDRHSISPLDIAFEDLIEHPLKNVNAILSFLGAPTGVTKILVEVKQTRDTITENVRSMYLSQYPKSKAI